ncbi:MAG TPA: hypothetical protein VGO93_20505, partial [Candidatus Xenobia bacterium]
MASGNVETSSTRRTQASAGLAVTRGRGKHAETTGLAAFQETLETSDPSVAMAQAQAAQVQGIRSAMGVMVPTQHPGMEVRSFGTYSPQEQADVRDKAVAMAKAGRLFIQSAPNAPLEKAAPFDLFNSLEYGQGG